MKRTLSFAKCQANGNDFAIFENFQPTPAQAIQLCHRQKGIGADGIISLDTNKSPVEMRIWNINGDEATMCGNGTLCVFRYLQNKGTFQLDKQAEIVIHNHTIKGTASMEYVEIGLAQADFAPANVPIKTTATDRFLNEYLPYRGQDKQLKVSAISLRNPHCVVLLSQNPWLGKLDELDLVSLADIQQSEYFPDSANIEFVEVIDKKHVRCRVIERGNGETLACGSGACAVVTVGFSLGILENEAFVEYRGGTLKARVDTDWTLYLSSNAYKVYEGTIQI